MRLQTNRRVLYKWVLILLIHFFRGPFVYAQKVFFDHFTVEDGLQNNIVLAASQDDKGFMWFATMTGIDRFDGTNFSNYKLPAKDNPNSYELVQVPFILFDKNHKLWAASATALYSYNGKLDRFELLDTVTNYLASLPSNILAMRSDTAGNIWIGTGAGLFVFKPATGQIITSATYRSPVRYFHRSEGNSMYAGTNRGIEWFELNNDRIEQKVSPFRGWNALESSQVLSLTRDMKGRYWVAIADAGLFVYDTVSHKGQKIPLPRSSSREFAVKDVYHNAADRKSYVSLDGAGLVIITDDLAIESINETNEDDPSSLSNNGAYDIFKDSFNRIWVTTYGGGINLVRPSSQPFTNYYHEINNKNSLSNNMAKAVTVDGSGRIWFGSRKGISVYTPGSGKWIHLNEEVRPHQFTADNVLALATGNNDNIWVGTYGGGLLRISPDLATIESFNRNAGDTNSIGTDYIYAVLTDSKNRVWSGGIRGSLSVFNKSERKFTRIPLNVVSINCLVESSNGKILAGTEKGMYSIDPESYTFELVFPGGKGPTPVSLTEKVSAILEYNPGEYWIGTQGNGVMILGTENDIERIITTGEGLLSDIICGMVKDKNGEVWISTSKGIAHVRTGDFSVTNYTKADGLAGSQFNYGSFYRTKNNELIFGSTNGFSIFNPDNIRAAGFMPTINFTGLLINNKRIQPGEEGSPIDSQLDDLSTLQLKYNQNSFTIEFISPVPAVTGKHLYSWKLEGFDKDWSPPSSVPMAVFTNLDDGKYKLLVKALIKGQREDASPVRKLEIVILTPWWRTAWAYLAYLLFAAGILFAAYNYYQIRSARKKFAERLKLNTSISHEIRTPLTLIKGPVSSLSESGNISEEDKNNLSLAKRNIEKLETIISQFIDYQKAGISKMQMQVTEADIIGFLSEITRSFLPLMKEKNIRFRFDTPPGEITLLFDKDKMEKVFNNLLSNAVKYTPEGKEINLKIDRDNKDVIIHVQDNGIGIPEQQQKFIFRGYFRADNTVNLKETGSGIGLNVAKELVEMHKGKLSFRSEADKGTVFTVRIPLNNEALRPYQVMERFARTEDQIPERKQLDNSSPGNFKILIAEDNDELRDYLKRELTGAGYRVLAVPDGSEAINSLRKQPVDLVITDVMMPEINGFQLCERIKKDIHTCHIPVIMLTAIHDKDYLLEGYRSGADDYVRKPFELSYMCTRIDNLLQNRTRFRNKIMSVFDQEESVVNNNPDIAWLKLVTERITENLSNPDFSVEKLSSMMAMSRPVLFRKFKAIASESPQQYIQKIRLRKAVELLQQGKFNINEVAFECGFSDAKYFSTAFKRNYGKTPSEYTKTMPA